MDPLTQGALGAAWAQAGLSVRRSADARLRKVRDATVLGALSGMAPDLDVLIQSSSDPLLFLEFHRHFTHSFAFIPIGALLCAGVLRFLVRGRMPFREVYLYCLLGYASHGLLDACTTYGTQLLWPFSDTRVAWNLVAVVDPLFSVPLGLAVAAAFLFRKPWLSAVGLGWGLFYLLLGTFALDRAEAMGRVLAAERSHAPVRLEAKPSFGNLLVWKVIYEHEGRYYVDAVRVGSSPMVYAGESAEKLDLEVHLPWLEAGSLQARDVERFRWFSDDFLAVDPEHGDRVIDVRYSMLPNEVDALWGIRLDPATPDEHVEYYMDRDASPEQGRRLLEMVLD